MSITMGSVILILIIAQSFLFAVVLATNKGPKRVSSTLLGLFLGALGIQMTIYLLLDLEKIHPTWLAATGVVFAYGPLMYLYARSLIHHPFQFHRLDPLHFLPAIAFITLMLLGVDMRSKFSWLLYVSLGVYVTLAFREINRYQRVLTHTQSAPRSLTLNWLKLSFGLFTILLSTDLIAYLLSSFTEWQIATEYVQNTVLVMVLVFVNFLLIKGLKQPQIFLGISSEESTLMESQGSLNKQRIFAEHGDEIEKLQAHMDSEKPFLNASLSIGELADQLSIPMRRVSLIINGYFEQNFSEFINSHRIEAAKQRFQNPVDPKETVLEVLYDVGFQSKSAFNTAFKKMTGMTPSEYRKQART